MVKLSDKLFITMASYAKDWSPLDILRYKFSNGITGLVYLKKGTPKVDSIYIDEKTKTPYGWLVNPIQVYFQKSTKKHLSIRQLLRKDGNMLAHFLRTHGRKRLL